MKNLKKVTDSQLAKWRFNPSDRKANVIHLGVLGMSVEIQKCGEIAFAVRMTIKGVRNSETLNHFVAGQYGLEAAMEDARKQRKAWRDQANGLVVDDDPADVPTLAQLLDRYAKMKGEDLPQTWVDMRALIECVYAPLLPRNTRTIKRDELHDAQTEYLDKRERETDHRPISSVIHAYRYVKPVLKWGCESSWLHPKTLAGWKTGLKKEKRRGRVVTPREWQLSAPALDALPKDIGLYVRYLFATAARVDMPSTMRWRDLRIHNVGTPEAPKMLTIWGVPDPQNMKAGYAAVFPIVGESKRILDYLRAKAGTVKPDDFVWPKAPRTAWIERGNPDYWQKKINEASGTKGWHRHDIRRTMATLLQFVKADMADIKLMLDHKERDEDGSSTPCYTVLDEKGLESLARLAVKVEEVHALVRDIEAGKDSTQLRNLYAKLDSSPKVIEWWFKTGVDRDTMVEIKPDPRHGDGKVTPIRGGANAA